MGQSRETQISGAGLPGTSFSRWSFAPVFLLCAQGLRLHSAFSVSQLADTISLAAFSALTSSRKYHGTWCLPLCSDTCFHAET